MKNKKIEPLVAELSDEIKRIRVLLDENKKLIQIIKNVKGVEFVNIRAQASIIHDFYTGIERIFKKIAIEINGSLPTGEDWHKRLLYQMSLEIKGLRPAVISGETYKILSQLLSFRHLVRNIYGFDLDKKEVNKFSFALLKKGAGILKEINKFVFFLSR